MEHELVFQSRKGQRHSNADGMSKMNTANKEFLAPNSGEKDDDEFQCFAREAQGCSSNNNSSGEYNDTNVVSVECKGRTILKMGHKSVATIVDGLFGFHVSEWSEDIIPEVFVADDFWVEEGGDY